MRRELIPSNSFAKALHKTIKKNPQLMGNIRQTLTLLEEDAHNPTLRTHKLKGRLNGNWSSTVQYDLRIVFQFVHQDGSEAILLGDIGTHEEVY